MYQGKCIKSYGNQNRAEQFFYVYEHMTVPWFTLNQGEHKTTKGAEYKNTKINVELKHTVQKIPR